MAASVKWSYTTVNTLRQCNRKFYFSAILPTHGRKDPLRRKAYELKNMQNLKMWAGSVVDKFMEVKVIPMISKKMTLNFEQLADQALAMAEEQFRFSKNALYTDPAQKKGEVNSTFCILNIHEVNEPYSEEELFEAYQTIKQGIRNLPLIRMPDGTMLIDYLTACNSLTPNVNNWEVNIENARVKPQMDLLGLSSWKPVIMDWKLSSSFTSDYSRQLIICGITVYLKRLENIEKPPYAYEDIKLFEVNLLKGIVKEHLFTQEKAHELINFINLTADDIFTLVGTSEAPNEIEDFELTDNDGLCTSCNFQTLCSFLVANKNQYDEKLFTKSIQAKQSV
jgi:hypothetical protein